MTRTTAALFALACALVAPATLAQQPGPNAPRAGFVYPAGGQRGTTVQAIVGGQFLNGVDEVIVSGRGARASVITVDLPLNGQQITALRDQIQALAPKASEPAVRQQLSALRMKLGDSLQRNRNPGLADRVTIEVTIDRDAEPGVRFLRLRSMTGLSAPLRFVVGQLPEARERDVKTARADTELAVTLPVTVNGRLIPGDIDNVRQPLRQPAQYRPGDADRYRFQARAGQDLVVSIAARELMPYLADAVPGWIQIVATLFDSAGREVAGCDDYRFRPDPAFHFAVPADGEYVLEIRDAIYRGREDFVYRATIGELPFITHVFPLGARAGTKTRLEVAGWNLPAEAIHIEAGRSPGLESISTRQGDLDSNAVPFAVGTLPEQFEREPNNGAGAAQPISLPVLLNGRIGERGDWDVFSFKGRAGEEVVAEVIARRLDSPVDAVIELTDNRGTRLALTDDREDKRAGLLTHHADAYVMARLPANGTYLVRVGDVQGKGGREYAYRLRVSAPEPDFELRASPSAINAAPGAHVPVTVTAIRKDGFAGDIALALSGAAPGFAVAGGMIPAGCDQVRMTILAPPATGRDSRAPDEVRIEGRATINGRAVRREAAAADDRQQAFASRHLVPADMVRISVAARGGTRVPIRLLASQPVRLQPGVALRVQVALPPAYQTFENLQFELSDPPDGIAIGGSVTNPSGAGASFEIRVDSKAPAGLRGNLIVVMSGERVPPPNAQGQQARRRVPIAVLPAIAFEIGSPPRS